MENLNYSLKSNNKLNKRNSFRRKMDDLLMLCEEFKLDATHIYLCGDSCRFLRSIQECQYYEHKFNELGISLVFPKKNQERVQ